MNSKKFVNATGIIALIFGLLRIPTAFFNLPTLQRLSLTFGLSPFPDPYNHPSIVDPKDPFRGLTFGCEIQGRVVGQNTWSYFTRGALSGPHRRTMGFGGYFNFLFIDRDQVQQERFEQLTRYYFCNGGPLAEVAHCPAKIDSAIISVTDQRYGVVTHEARVSCTP